MDDVDRIVVRGHGSARRRSNPESGEERRHGCSGGGPAEGSGRGGLKCAVRRVESSRGELFAGSDNGIQDAGHHHTMFDSENDSESPPKQIVASTVGQGFVGGKELEPAGLAVPQADLELDGATNVQQQPDSGCGEIDQEGGVETHPGRDASPPSPLEEGGEGCSGIERTGAGLVTGELDPEPPNRPQSPTKNHEKPFAQPAEDFEGARGSESVDQPHIQGESPTQQRKEIPGG